MRIFRRRKRVRELPISSVISNAILMRAEKRQGEVKIIDFSHLQGFNLKSKIAI